jgi:hypothetical protein
MITVEFDNVDYQVNISDNYRKLKKFIESTESDNWAFKPKADEYLGQIKLFSKIDIKGLYPEYDSELMLEQLNVPLLPNHQQYFNHLVLQLTFFRIHRLENLLDYHLRSYCKLFPDGGESFLSQLEHHTCNVIEHNVITDYQTRLNIILQWIRANRLRFGEGKSNNVTYNIQNNLNLHNHFDITNIYVTYEAQKKPAKEKVKNAGLGLTTNLNPDGVKQLCNVLVEYLEVGTSQNEMEKLLTQLALAVKGQPILPFLIEERNLTKFCNAVRSLTGSKKILSKESKASLAKWIVHYFRQRKKEDAAKLSYTYVYKVLRGG